MPTTLTKADAYSQANARARSGATVADIIADADKIFNYVNGTTGQSCASAAPKPLVKTLPRTYYKAEYKDRVGLGVHFGKKEYKTYNGALKNNRSTAKATRSANRNTRFIRVVKFVESAS